ncbi:Ppx/GppA phosphatase family protein [Teichococcus aestuarii]|uniref:Ppx/GppA phosphatase family protein n=1 Tax=Teichococcus aestuarii TaxID=568898 RepID=UPI0036142205
MSNPAVARFHPPSAAAGGAFAAIDLGTNNCRLLVGTPTQSGTFRVLDSYSRVVRLGEGLAGEGRLSEGAMERALLALQTCAQKLLRRPLRRLLAVTTEACRRRATAAPSSPAPRPPRACPSASSRRGRRRSWRWNPAPPAAPAGPPRPAVRHRRRQHRDRLDPRRRGGRRS